MIEIVKKLKASKPGEIVRPFFRHENVVIAMILVAIVAGLAVITKGATLTRSNISNIWLQSSTRGIAAIGQLFVILTAGIDISVGGIALVSAILGASLMTRQTGFPVTAIAIMMLLGLGIGALNGSLVSRVPMPAIIVTLGMWQVTRGGGYLICRGHTILHLPEGVNFFGAGNIAGVPVPVIIFTAVAAVAYFVLYHTTFGRSVYIVGGNPISAELSGINTKKVIFSVYVISALMAALAGLITLGRTMCGGMTTVIGLELSSISAVFIGGVSLAGGRGTLIGVVIGVMIIGVIDNGMNVFAVNPAYRDIVKGMIIIGAVAVDYWRRRR